jgi:hypothetical protein
MSRDPWFHDKLIGWGLIPASWQGGVATAVFIVVFVLTLTLGHPLRGSIAAHIGLAVFELVAFIVLAHLTSTHVEPR